MRSRPRKVLHVLHAFSHGGLENGIVNIINESPADLKHELCFLTNAGEFLNRIQKPVRHYELKKKPGNSINTIFQLRRIFAESGADIVHTRNWGAFDGVIAACLCPGVILLHGEHGRDMTDPQGLSPRRNFFRRLFSPRIRKFTTVSVDLARWLSKEIRIPRDKIVLIPNGVDTERFRPHRDPELRKELGILNEEYVIGTIGRLDPVKNHRGLVQSFAALANRTRTIRLVIVGDGPEKKSLENLIGELGVSPAVVITGYRGDIERFYGLFDVFVLNSFAEGMSNTLLEAMSSGLPILCTPVGANVDLIDDGIRGRFVPVNDTICLAERLNDSRLSPEFCLNTGKAARAFVETHYSLSQMIRHYGAFYLNL